MKHPDNEAHCVAISGQILIWIGRKKKYTNSLEVELQDIPNEIQFEFSHLHMSTFNTQEKPVALEKPVIGTVIIL